MSVLDAKNKYISIHTLTWRVTPTAEEQARFEAISIHTLTWRVTPYANDIKIEVMEFQSTPSRGG